MDETAEISGLSYEKALSELEKIIATLENEEHPLEEAMTLFERGQALAKHCLKLLEQAELKVKQLSNETLNQFDESE